MEIQLATECPWCGEDLTPEEIEYPATEEVGENICDDCRHEHFEFECAWCMEYGHVDDQHTCLVVFEHLNGEEIKPGLYWITKGPYFCSNMFSMWLYPDAIERFADIPDGLGQGCYECGHLCMGCIRKVLSKLRA